MLGKDSPESLSMPEAISNQFHLGDVSRDNDHKVAVDCQANRNHLLPNAQGDVHLEQVDFGILDSHTCSHIPAEEAA